MDCLWFCHSFVGFAGPAELSSFLALILCSTQFFYFTERHFYFHIFKIFPTINCFIIFTKVFHFLAFEMVTQYKFIYLPAPALFVSSPKPKPIACWVFPALRSFVAPQVFVFFSILIVLGAVFAPKPSTFIFFIVLLSVFFQ